MNSKLKFFHTRFFCRKYSLRTIMVIVSSKDALELSVQFCNAKLKRIKEL